MDPPELSREDRKIVKRWSKELSKFLPRILRGRILKIPPPLNWWILEVWLYDLFAKVYAEQFMQALGWWVRSTSTIPMPMTHREYTDKATMLICNHPEKTHALKPSLIQVWGALMTRAKPEDVHRAGYKYCQAFKDLDLSSR